jgi:hypothetical protein
VVNKNEGLVLAETRDRRGRKGLFWKPLPDKQRFEHSNKYPRERDKDHEVALHLEMGGAFQQDNRTQEKRPYCVPEQSNDVLFGLVFATRLIIKTTLMLLPTGMMKSQTYSHCDLAVLPEALPENQCSAAQFDLDFETQQNIIVTLMFIPMTVMKKQTDNHCDLADPPEALFGNQCNTDQFDLVFETQQNIKPTLNFHPRAELKRHWHLELAVLSEAEIYPNKCNTAQFDLDFGTPQNIKTLMKFPKKRKKDL